MITDALKVDGKVKYVILFSFAYASVQLVVSLLALVGGEPLLSVTEGVIMALIWGYIGYMLGHKKQKATYLLALFFLALLIIRPLSAFGLIYSLEGEEGISTLPLDTVIIALVFAVLSAGCLYILSKREVRSQYWTTKA